MSAVKTDRVFKLAAGVCLAVLIWAVYDTFFEKIVEVGQTAPGFSVTTDSGRTITPSSFGGKLLVLNFWATWCPPCVEEVPSLNELQQKFGSEGLVVLGVSVDRSQRTYKQFLQRAKVAYLTARDPEASISASYGTFKYPETYIIDRSGKVVEKIIGAPERGWMDPAMLSRVRSLLAS